MADLVAQDYVWRWETRIHGAGNAWIKAEFRQSSHLGTVLSPHDIKTRAETHRPVLDANGEIDRFILGEMDGETSVGTIAERVRARFPDALSSPKDALARVGRLSRKYSRRPQTVE
jgi:hypothetical protein